MIGPDRSARIYYLHPLLAGPVANWRRHFERCQRLGFDQILLAPPFLPGRSGDIFLAADYRQLHPQLGGGDALDILAHVAGTAGEYGLCLLLDLVIDRVAVESDLAAEGVAYRRMTEADAPPDPRLPAQSAFAAALCPDVPDEIVLSHWRDRIGVWQQAGIGGFRCLAPHRVAASVWKRLIGDARAHDPEASFIAWVPGLSAGEIHGFAGCGFDLASSSSWAWDFRADWLEDDARRIGAVGRLLAMPELPFGTRLAAQGPDAEKACRRSLAFAASYGHAWLMPMGFEFGAVAALDAVSGNPDDFSALAAHPFFDLGGAVAAANAAHRAIPAAGDAQLISVPDAPAAVFARRAPRGGNRRGGILALVNAALDRPASVDLTLLLPALDGVPGGGETAIVLGPGELREIHLDPLEPIRLKAMDKRAVQAAIAAPRIAIEAVSPAIDAGRFPVKRIVGTSIEVTADIVCDGHGVLGACILWRPADEAAWNEAPLSPVENDRWVGSFPLRRTGRHVFTIEAWVDAFANYHHELEAKHAAGLGLDLEIQEGCALVAQLAARSESGEVAALARRIADASAERRLELLLAPETLSLMAGPHAREFTVRHGYELTVDAERRAAGFANWYEIFPRSQSLVPGQHGTFDDVIERLPAVRDMGFDVLYFPPIHPIGTRNRKGRNNSLRAEPGDVGSPYAIGSVEGGHDAIHPLLGTLDDFRRLLAAAAAHGIEIALDFAIQCAPDHPWLKEHPEWFNWRPDGSIRYAENPPKKYEDIVNVAFYAEAAMPSLWLALRDIVRFWVGQGVKIFRVDNPHTKPLPFWEWLIADIRGQDPEVIFLAEAFTRPKMMYRLAKIGFSQSYTYFTWRNSAWEMREYLSELTAPGPRDFFRPHFFVNTPDINPSFLHHSGRPGFLLRAALAATLSGLWGMYNGYELCEGRALDGREEYLDSEKYQLRGWDLDRPGNIVPEIRLLNQIRRANPALQSHLGVHFLPCGDDWLLCYVKATPGHDNVLLVVVSFDPHEPREAEFDLLPEALGMSGHGTMQAHDLVGGGTETWHTGLRRVRLDPSVLPYTIWRLRPSSYP